MHYSFDFYQHCHQSGDFIDGRKCFHSHSYEKEVKVQFGSIRSVFLLVWWSVLWPAQQKSLWASPQCYTMLTVLLHHTGNMTGNIQNDFWACSSLCCCEHFFLNLFCLKCVCLLFLGLSQTLSASVTNVLLLLRLITWGPPSVVWQFVIIWSTAKYALLEHHNTWKSQRTDPACSCRGSYLKIELKHLLLHSVFHILI